MSYTQVFGGNSISPSFLSYSALTLDADTQLYWPLEASSTGPYAAQKMGVTPDTTGRTLTLPDATLVSTGTDILIINDGADTFTVASYGGAVIGTVASGQSWYFYLTDNSTAAGSWGSTQFGAGTSSASAASLAGLGLVAMATLLNTAFTTSTKNASYTLVANDRASVVVNTGGTVTFSLTAASTLGATWFALIRNDGSGALTIDPDSGELIDGSATKVLQIGESCFVTCDGTQFRSVGYGRSITNTVTALNVPGGGGAGTQTLSSSEVAAQIQTFTGTLTGNRNYEYGTAPGFWFVSNTLTLGGFTATWRVNNLDAGVTSANLASGSRTILVSNGTNMFIAVPTTAGTVTSVATGTGLTGGPITTTGTVSLANTAVTPGAYKLGNITVDAQGRITAASAGGPGSSVSGNLASFNGTGGDVLQDTGIASSDVYRLGTSQTVTAVHSYSAGQRGTPSALAYAANIALDFATSNNFHIAAMTGNLVLDNPTNVVAGQSGIIRVLQDGTGGRTLTLGANWSTSGGGALDISTGANEVTLLSYYAVSATDIFITTSGLAVS